MPVSELPATIFIGAYQVAVPEGEPPQDDYDPIDGINMLHNILSIWYAAFRRATPAWFSRECFRSVFYTTLNSVTKFYDVVVHEMDNIYELSTQHGIDLTHKWGQYFLLQVPSVRARLQDLRHRLYYVHNQMKEHTNVIPMVVVIVNYERKKVIERQQKDLEQSANRLATPV